MNIHAALTLILVATAALSPHRARADGAPTDGLIHQWHFDEGTGTTAYDSIGTWDFFLENGATLNAPGIMGTAANLDGVDDLLITRGDASFMASDFTLSLWENFVPSKSKLGLLTVFSGKATVVVDLGYGDPIPSLSPGTTTQARSLNDGHFHLITFVKTANGTALYVDGTSVASGIFPKGLGQVVGLQIGQVDTSHFFSGQIDEVSIYNRALSPAEIAQAAAVPEPGTTLLLAAALGSLWLRRHSPDFHHEGTKTRRG